MAFGGPIPHDQDHATLLSVFADWDWSRLRLQVARAAKSDEGNVRLCIDGIAPGAPQVRANLLLNLIATVGDPQSGVGGFALATISGTDGAGATKEHNLEWACAGTGQIQGILELGTLVPNGPLTPTTGATPAQINVDIDPVGQTAACPTRLLDGFIRVVATNGAGLTATSGTLLFDFSP
jgi:hypothetical protein